MGIEEQRSMRPVNLGRGVGVVVAAFLALGASASNGEDWLITPEEASMPEAPAIGQNGVTTRGLIPLEASREIDTGPLIEVLKPSAGKVQSTPVEIDVKFTPRNAPVDVTSLKVQVVKLVPIDITDRVKPYTKDEGIHIPDAKLPGGEHKVRISLSDKDGGLTRKEMTVSIP